MDRSMRYKPPPQKICLDNYRNVHVHFDIHKPGFQTCYVTAAYGKQRPKDVLSSHNLLRLKEVDKRM